MSTLFNQQMSTFGEATLVTECHGTLFTSAMALGDLCNIVTTTIATTANASAMALPPESAADGSVVSLEPAAQKHWHWICFSGFG